MGTLISSQTCFYWFFSFLKSLSFLFQYYKMDIKPFIWKAVLFFMLFLNCCMKQYHAYSCKPNAIVKQFKQVFILKQFLLCSPDDSLDFASYLSTPLTFWTNVVVLLDFQWNFLCKYTNWELFKLWRWYHYSAHIMWLLGIFHLIQHQHVLIQHQHVCLNKKKRL